jgi:hypothetical protein
MVELALGSLVFVTVLVGGIYFAEVGHLSLKVQEAQMSAVWSAAGQAAMTREASGDVNQTPPDQIPTTVKNTATGKYQDFNGLRDQGNNELRQVFTRGHDLKVDCFPREAGSEIGFAPTPTTARFMPDTGTIHCKSSAVIGNLNVPVGFMTKREGGFFSKDIIPSAPLQVCGVGRATGTECKGAISIMTNDWGLYGEATKSCPRNGCNQSIYKNTVNALFQGGGSASVTLAEMVGGAPNDPSKFYFSYVDRADGYKESTGYEGIGGQDFTTGGPGVGMLEGMTETTRDKFGGK